MEVNERAAMNGINKNKEERCQQQQQTNQQTTSLDTNKRNNTRLGKDLLCCIVVTAPVFHFEMSELKAELDRNTAQ